METKTNDTTFQVSDLYLAVFLKAKYGLLIQAITREGGRLNFAFAVPEHINPDEIIRSYYNGQTQINALAFVRELKDMKSIIHTAKAGNSAH